MILAAIVVCEIAFWVAILGGLAARYIARRRRLGAALLICAPVIDVILLALVTADLLGGASASWHHGLAALYIGISIAYGHRMIAWADGKFAQRFDGAERPPKLTGGAYTRACWRDAGLTLLAAAIAGGVLGGLIAIVGAPERTAELTGFFPVLGIIVGIDVLWAISYTLWPKSAKAVGPPPCGRMRRAPSHRPRRA